MKASIEQVYLSENKIYMSESLYGDLYDLVHRPKIVDIATGASEVKPVQKKDAGFRGYRLDSTQSLKALEFMSLRRRVLVTMLNS